MNNEHLREIKHFNIRVTGRVQMVFFRASAQKEAEALGISGFIRNEEDGTLYIETEGEENVLEKFVEWCKKGPPQARVTRVEKEEGKLKGFESFLIY